MTASFAKGRISESFTLDEDTLLGFAIFENYLYLPAKFAALH